MNGLTASIIVQGRQFECRLGSEHGIVLVGDAAHSHWQPSTAGYFEGSDFPPLQDRIVEQIGNGVSLLCIGWHDQVLNLQQKLNFFEFLSVGALEYPLLHDFKDSQDLQLALENLPGKPLVKLPAYDDPQLRAFLEIGQKYAVQWLCPVRSYKSTPWSQESKYKIIEQWQTILKQEFAVYLPLPAQNHNPQALFDTFAGITSIKERYRCPVVIRPSGSRSTVSKGWLQAALTVWAMERGADALLLNPLQREVANAGQEAAGLMQRSIQKLPLEMKRWIK